MVELSGRQELGKSPSQPIFKKSSKKFGKNCFILIFALPKRNRILFPGVKDLVAQLVEQYTFNVWALGSSPSGITKDL